MKHRTFWYAWRASLPVMAGYLVLGAGFGILLTSKGYGWWWVPLMSVCIYAGSMQYVAVDLLSGGASLLTAALMTLVVNVRHLFYGVAMLAPYRDTGAAKPYLIFSLTDETFSLVCAPELPADVSPKGYRLWVSLLDQCYWVAGSLAGALVGSAAAFDSAGVEFSMTALFVVIFLEQWEKEKRHLPALTGVGCALVCLVIFGPADFLIPAMVAIAAVLLGCRRRLEGGERP